MVDGAWRDIIVGNVLNGAMGDPNLTYVRGVETRNFAVVSQWLPSDQLVTLSVSKRAAS